MILASQAPLADHPDAGGAVILGGGWRRNLGTPIEPAIHAGVGILRAAVAPGRCLVLTVPWQLILKQAPVLLTAAGDLLIKSRHWSADITTAKDLNALRDRCADLAKDQQAYAELFKQLTDQVNAINMGLRRCIIVGAVGVALGLVACAIALLR